MTCVKGWLFRMSITPSTGCFCNTSVCVSFVMNFCMRWRRLICWGFSFFRRYIIDSYVLSLYFSGAYGMTAVSTVVSSLILAVYGMKIIWAAPLEMTWDSSIGGVIDAPGHRATTWLSCQGRPAVAVYSWRSSEWIAGAGGCDVPMRCEGSTVLLGT
jgi:hypothetical protein